MNESINQSDGVKILLSRSSSSGSSIIIIIIIITINITTLSSRASALSQYGAKEESFLRPQTFVAEMLGSSAKNDFIIVLPC